MKSIYIFVYGKMLAPNHKIWLDYLVVSGSINGLPDDLMLDISARYYWNGMFFLAGASDVAGGLSICVGTGKSF